MTASYSIDLRMRRLPMKTKKKKIRLKGGKRLIKSHGLRRNYGNELVNILNDCRRIKHKGDAYDAFAEERGEYEEFGAVMNAKKLDDLADEVQNKCGFVWIWSSSSKQWCKCIKLYGIVCVPFARRHR
eukprot:210824_1